MTLQPTIHTGNAPTQVLVAQPVALRTTLAPGRPATRHMALHFPELAAPSDTPSLQHRMTRYEANLLPHLSVET